MTISAKQPLGRPIALIGYRGSGKTVVAREIATLIAGDSVDTDDVVATLVGKSIADIFASEGERAFRGYESEAIAGVVENPPEVISVGGGAVLDSQNVRRLREACFVVWLVACPEVLWQRISDDQESASLRPPLTDEGRIDEVRAVLATREDLYRGAANDTVDTTDRTPQEIAKVIIALAKEFASR